MFTLATLAVISASPAPLQDWEGVLVEYGRPVEGATVTAYEAAPFPGHQRACLTLPEGRTTATLMDPDCGDNASLRQLAALASKAPKLNQLATTTSSERGQFTMRVPAQTLFILVTTKARALSAFLVRPGTMKTVLTLHTVYSSELNSALAKAIRGINKMLSQREDIWLIGDDNPLVRRFTAADIEALKGNRFTDVLLPGCSTLVTSKGAHRVELCVPYQPQKSSSLERPVLVSLTGRVANGAGPVPKANVRILTAGPPQTLTLERNGTFEIDHEELPRGAVVVAQSGSNLIAASLFDRKKGEPFVLQLNGPQAHRLRIRSSQNVPARGALVSVEKADGFNVEQRTDATGEIVVPPAFDEVTVTAKFAGHRKLTRSVDLRQTKELTLEAASPFIVNVVRDDGLIIQVSDITCAGCEDVAVIDPRTATLSVQPSRSTVRLIVNDDGRIVPTDVDRSGAVAVRSPTEMIIDSRAFDLIPKLQWSNGGAAPLGTGWNHLLLCESEARRGCSLQSFDVKSPMLLTLTKPERVVLQIQTKNHRAGKKMPQWVELESLYGETGFAYFDVDGTAKVEVTPGWHWVSIKDSTFNSPPTIACHTSRPCIVHLDRETKRGRILLTGSVPGRVSLEPTTLWGAEEGDVHDGGVLNFNDEFPPVSIDHTTSVPRIEEKDVIVSLAPPTTVEVHVVDETGADVPDAWVSFGLSQRPWINRAPFTNARTAADGRVRFENLRPGNVPLRIEKQGFALAQTQRTDAKNEVRLEVARSLGCTIRSKKIAVQASCSATIDDAQLSFAEGWPNERLQLDALPSGRVTVYAFLVDERERRRSHYDTTQQTHVMFKREVEVGKTSDVVFDADIAGPRLTTPLLDASFTFNAGEGTEVTMYCVRHAWSESFCTTGTLAGSEVKVQLRHGRRKLSWTHAVKASERVELLTVPDSVTVE